MSIVARIPRCARVPGPPLRDSYIVRYPGLLYYLNEIKCVVIIQLLPNPRTRSFHRRCSTKLFADLAPHSGG